MYYDDGDRMGLENTMFWDICYLGTKIASGSDDLMVIVWDWVRRKKITSFPTGHRENVFQVRFTQLVMEPEGKECLAPQHCSVLKRQKFSHWNIPLTFLTEIPILYFISFDAETTRIDVKFCFFLQSKFLPGDLLITSCSRDGQVRLAQLCPAGSLR